MFNQDTLIMLNAGPVAAAVATPGWTGYGNPGLSRCRLTSFVLRLLSVQKEFEVASLADFLCCRWIWIGQLFLPSSVLEFNSFIKVQAAWSFAR